MKEQLKTSFSILSHELRSRILRTSVLAACLICALSVNARPCFSGVDDEANSTTQLTVRATPTADDLEQVTLTLNADGFTPATLTRAAGRFLLSVDNRSGVAELTLRLNKASGELVREIKVSKGELDWSEEIDLQAGQYTLTEANHTTWVSHITAQ